MKRDEIERLCIEKDLDLKTTLKRIDEGGKGILFVTEDNGKLFGVLTNGDLRRWIVSTGNLQEGYVREFCNTNPTVVYSNYSLSMVKKLMLSRQIAAIPVLDDNDKIMDILLWEHVFSEKQAQSSKKHLDVPIVIMAGGKGTRLDPFTRILPKPLIPVGDKPVIEVIIDKFTEYGIHDFYLSINHKSKMIKAYFEEFQHTYTLHYLEENEPLGTAGSLKLLEDRYQGSFFVSNCDILIESDYTEILDYHHENENDITLVAAVKNYRIPYGICEIENGGILRSIKEKPEYNFLVNTGLYVMKSATLQLIPEHQPFDMTDLVEIIWDHGGKVGIFPVSEHSWIDIGEWEEYKKAIQKFSF